MTSRGPHGAAHHVRWSSVSDGGPMHPHATPGTARVRRAVDQGHHAIDIAAVDHLLGIQIQRLRRQSDEAIRHRAVEGDGHAFGGEDLRPVVDDDMGVHHPGLEVQGDGGVRRAHQGREVSIDRRMVDDRPSAGGDREVERPADVSVEMDRAALGGQRPGESAPAGGIIEVEIPGVGGRVTGEGTPEVQAQLERRGTSDIRAEVDARGVQPEHGIAAAGIGEGADEIDVRVRLQVDVRRGERRIEGGRTDRGLPERGQRTGALRAAGEDIDHIRVEQPRTRPPERGQGRDEGLRGDGDLGRRGVDEPAVTAARGADVQATGDTDQPAGARGQQQDAAFLTGGQSLRLDQAGVIDGRAGEIPRRGRRQQHLAARRQDGAAIGDERIHRTLLQLEPDDAPEGKRDLAGGREPDAALGGRDRTLIQDLGRD